MVQARLLNSKQAAAYLGMSADTFRKVVPVRPIDFRGDSRIVRYDRKALDSWLDAQSGLSDDANLTPMEKWVKERDQGYA